MVLRAVPEPRANGLVQLVEVPVLGPVILAVSRSDRMRRLVSAAPVTKPVVDRFIVSPLASHAPSRANNRPWIEALHTRGFHG